LCGTPHEGVILIRDVLAVLSNEDERPEKLEAVLPHAGARHIVLCWLETAGYSDHGGSIGAGWLTDKGEAALALLSKMDDDELAELTD
jgi:hypothetical protein